MTTQTRQPLDDRDLPRSGPDASRLSSPPRSRRERALGLQGRLTAKEGVSGFCVIALVWQVLAATVSPMWVSRWLYRAPKRARRSNPRSGRACRPGTGHKTRRGTMTLITVRTVMLGATVLMLAGCPGMMPPDDPPQSGQFPSNQYGVPASIIGYQFTGAVLRNYSGGVLQEIPEGDFRQVYMFISNDRIRARQEFSGTLSHLVGREFDFPTRSWSYARTGTTEATLVYNFTNGTVTTQVLTFTGYLRGTYRSDSEPAGYWSTGTFLIAEGSP